MPPHPGRPMPRDDKKLIMGEDDKSGKSQEDVLQKATEKASDADFNTTYLSFDEFNTEVPAFNVPEYILIKVRDPTNGSLATLKARAEKFSFSSNFIVTLSSEPTLVSSIDLRTMSSSYLTPHFLE